MPNPPARHPHELSERILARQIASHERTVRLLATREDLSSTVLEISIRDGVALAAVMSISDPTDIRLIDGLRASARAGAAMFAAMGAGQPVDVEIAPGTLRRVAPFSPDENTGALAWCRAFFAAVCVGDAYSLERITQISTELLRRSPPQSPDFVYTEIDALCSFHQRRADTPAQLSRALASAAPARLPAPEQDLALDVVRFELELLFRFADSDATGFNTALAASLVGHEHYFSEASRASDVTGQLALGPLAAACIANDRGIEVTVESDYIPRAVIEYPRSRS